eukprot:2128786-Prymnesium_polylepis.1
MAFWKSFGNFVHFHATFLRSETPAGLLALARGMGLVLDGELILPRHSEEAFKNFCTWFALDAERS